MSDAVHAPTVSEELVLLLDDGRPTTLVGRIREHLAREWQLYVLLAPTIIWILMFSYKPMYGLQIAFKDYSVFKGIGASPWVGLEHFQTLFENDQFLRAIRNTFLISF